MSRPVIDIQDRRRMLDILEQCDCCRLAIPEPDGPYIVPLNFGFTDDGAHLCLYFHTASTGRKLDLLRRDGAVGFEADCSHALITDADACNHGFFFRSVLGKGRVSFVTDEAERTLALTRIMHHYTKRTDWSFRPNVLARVTILRLDVDVWSCREHT